MPRVLRSGRVTTPPPAKQSKERVQHAILQERLTSARDELDTCERVVALAQQDVVALTRILREAEANLERFWGKAA